MPLETKGLTPSERDPKKNKHEEPGWSITGRINPRRDINRTGNTDHKEPGLHSSTTRTVQFDHSTASSSEHSGIKKTGEHSRTKETSEQSHQEIGQHKREAIKILKEHNEGNWSRWRGKLEGIQIDLSESDLHGLDLRGYNLSNVSLANANLRNTDLSDADLRNTDLSDATLVKTKFRGADLRHAKLVRANLTDANLSEAFLQDADFRNAVSSKKTNLTEADLTDATLEGANLRGAILTKANLTNATLTKANLIGADLTDASVAGATLSRASLKEAKFNRVDLSQTIFENVDLSETIGLETAKHSEPSVIDIDTIDRSRINISIEFLRRAGTPKIIIDSMFASADHPMKYHTCFISYSSKDEAFIKRLYTDLPRLGVTCWYAPVNLPIGGVFDRLIREAIRKYEKLLLVLSEHSVQSEWVEREVKAALKKERLQKRLVLFPITLDEAFNQTNAPWAAVIRRTRHIGDFTSWQQPGVYQSALAHLLHALKADS